MFASRMDTQTPVLSELSELRAAQDGHGLEPPGPRGEVCCAEMLCRAVTKEHLFKIKCLGTRSQRVESTATLCTSFSIT